MISKNLLLLVTFLASISVILSIPFQLKNGKTNAVIQILPIQEDLLNSLIGENQVGNNVEDQVEYESFPVFDEEARVGNTGSLFNLSSTLQGAPNNTAALHFIPLITLLFG